MTLPTQFTEAFGVNADPGTINAIPPTTATPGAASFDKGFPVATMTNPASGGVPPFGQDFNGIFEQITDVLTFLNLGQAFPFSSAVATDISGYPPGAVVQSSRTDFPGTGFWLNITAGNTTDPDGGSAAGWVPVNNYGKTSVTLTGSDVTLTPQQYARYIIVLSGALTANVNLVLPALQLSWLIVNTCTGAHTVTAKTPSGTGVTVPAGGFASPTGVYSEGTNIYADSTPLTVPIDVAPTANTLVERDGTGNVNALRLNQSAAVENPTIGSIGVQNNSADGFLRFISKLNFIAQLFPNTGGSVNLGSLIIKYGTTTGSGAGVPVTFGVPFPTAMFGAVVTNNAASGAFNASAAYTRFGFTLYSGTGAGTSFWIALGN